MLPEQWQRLHGRTGPSKPLGSPNDPSRHSSHKLFFVVLIGQPVHMMLLPACLHAPLLGHGHGLHPSTTRKKPTSHISQYCPLEPYGQSTQYMLLLLVMSTWHGPSPTQSTHPKQITCPSCCSAHCPSHGQRVHCCPVQK
ncbi:hypothetical protein ORF024L [Spotted knifejaw iridovirus]|nr:hypothetical protein ORF024L [Spotted knifejaw iridovirus]